MGCEDGHAFMFYDWQTRQAIMIWAIAGGYQVAVGAKEIAKNYVLLIRFDSEDIVKNYEITTRPWYESYGDHLREWIEEDEKSKKNKIP